VVDALIVLHFVILRIDVFRIHIAFIILQVARYFCPGHKLGPVSSERTSGLEKILVLSLDNCMKVEHWMLFQSLNSASQKLGFEANERFDPALPTLTFP